MLPFLAVSQEIRTPNYNLGVLINRGEYILFYDERNEQPLWVSYTLTEQGTSLLYERDGTFKKDSKVYSGSASKEDYAGSGFDIGHLAPSRDFPQDPGITFFFSNASPQHPSFNRGIWLRLENYVRKCADKFKSVDITTGPAYLGGETSIGPNKVTVPGLFYKVLLVEDPPGSYKVIGFVMPNRSCSEDIFHFAVTVDSVESLTGLDFFYELEDGIERSIESKKDILFWNF